MVCGAPACPASTRGLGGILHWAWAPPGTGRLWPGDAVAMGVRPQAPLAQGLCSAPRPPPAMLQSWPSTPVSTGSYQWSQHHCPSDPAFPRCVWHQIGAGGSAPALTALPTPQLSAVTPLRAPAQTSPVHPLLPMSAPSLTALQLQCGSHPDTCVLTHAHACTAHMHAHTHAHTPACTHAHTVHTCTQSSVHSHTCMHTHADARTYCTHACTAHVCTHACTHQHVHMHTLHAHTHVHVDARTPCTHACTAHTRT